MLLREGTPPFFAPVYTTVSHVDPRAPVRSRLSRAPAPGATVTAGGPPGHPPPTGFSSPSTAGKEIGGHRNYSAGVAPFIVISSPFSRPSDWGKSLRLPDFSFPFRCQLFVYSLGIAYRIHSRACRVTGMATSAGAATVPPPDIGVRKKRYTSRSSQKDAGAGSIGIQETGPRIYFVARSLPEFSFYPPLLGRCWQILFIRSIAAAVCSNFGTEGVFVLSLSASTARVS